MLKIMGSILVFAAAAGMAGTYKRELTDHLALLYALRKLLVDLSCYGNGTRPVSYTHLTLPTNSRV